MDIVDVDEALKDDSFIFLEDKTHDDISNILQQWKSSNCIPPSNNATHQPQQEQVYKYDSRTFTRPKRKSTQNLELQFANTHSNTQYHQNINNAQRGNPMLNLEIGGLVTNMNNSFLRDTSPPPFSSMDASIDRMNNSLITSADFTNINFLQSANSIDSVGYSNFNFANKGMGDGYSLNDMIRDRKALESLTMSSDGTLIKDSHIGQIDDISLTRSKTASGYSTMNNSTESVDVNNRTLENIGRNVNQSLKVGVELELASCCNEFKTSSNNISGIDCNVPNTLQGTMILSDEMIYDITYNLVENSMYSAVTSEEITSTTRNLGHIENCANENVSKPVCILNETICLSTVSEAENCLPTAKTVNSTFDCQNNTADERCNTPEYMKKNAADMKYYESTPHAPTVRCSKQNYNPKLKIIDDSNISPIVAITASHNLTRIVNDSFENKQYNNSNQTRNAFNTNTFSGNLATAEVIENSENPIFEKTFNRLEQQCSASIEMRNVMDLAEVEANILASNDNEDEFDHILNEISKVELNVEQLKMKKSLDSIKRRFNYGTNRDKLQTREISREAKDMRHMMRGSADILGENDNSSKDYLNMTIDIVSEGRDELTESKDNLVESPYTLNETSCEVIKRAPVKDAVATSSITDSKFSNDLSLSSGTTTSHSGERLLSRRSRLYDNFNMSTLSASSVHGTKTSLGSSFTVNSPEDVIGDIQPNVTNETETLNSQKPEPTSEGILHNQISQNVKESMSIDQYRLPEKRERDRDRFKTIKINKNPSSGWTCNDGAAVKLNVPCIDDYLIDGNVGISAESENINQRFSRKDQKTSPVLYNNKSEVEPNIFNKTASKTNPNFLTYKKPKDKQNLNVRNLPEVAPAPTTINVAAEVASSKPRSLSRPRYISGLTKLSTVCKATSADGLEKSITQQSNLNTTTVLKGPSVSSNRAQIITPSEKQTGELKSPMGIKSKSFHNLSCHHSTNNAVGVGSLALRTFGLKKPNVTGTSNEKLAKTIPNRNSCLLNTSNNQQPITQQKSEESIFKVPKLVSCIRAPGASLQGILASKRATIVRPSSGCYSLTVTGKSVQKIASEADADAGRYSPTDSISSASSKGSGQSLPKTIGMKTSAISINNVKSNTTSGLAKVTVGLTGIPKPSGLRQPSNIKRSGLPRPSSFIKTDK